MSNYRLLLPTDLVGQFNAFLADLGLTHKAARNPSDPGVLSRNEDDLQVETYDMGSAEIGEWLVEGTQNTAAILRQHERKTTYRSETPLNERLTTLFGVNTAYFHTYEITKPADLRAPLRLGTNYPDFFNAFRKSVGIEQDAMFVTPLTQAARMLREAHIDVAFAPLQDLPAPMVEKYNPHEKPDGARPIKILSNIPSNASLVTNHPDHPAFAVLKQWLTGPSAP